MVARKRPQGLPLHHKRITPSTPTVGRPHPLRRGGHCSPAWAGEGMGVRGCALIPRRGDRILSAARRAAPFNELLTQGTTTMLLLLDS
jgi:hypothetical protein